MCGDVCSSCKSSTTHWCVNYRERVTISSKFIENLEEMFFDATQCYSSELLENLENVFSLIL